MKFGCSGCIVLVLVLALGALLLVGAVGGVIRMLADPEVTPAPVAAADGSRAQSKLLDLARPSKRGETVTLSEAEVNALLARHLVEARGVRLSAPSARLIGGDRLVLNAQSSVRQLFDEVSLGLVADVLPSRWQARPVWVHVGARVRVDGGPRRQLRMDVDEFAVGRQRLPSPLLRVMLDPASVGLLQWSLPSHVERVGIEPGRVVIRTAASP
jgi:hypothetical protein